MERLSVHQLGLAYPTKQTTYFYSPRSTTPADRKSCCMRPKGPRLDWRRDAPIAQTLLGILCYLFEIFGLSTPLSRSFVGPGVYCGFFFILAGAFGLQTYYYRFQYFPTVTGIINTPTVVVAVVGIIMCALSIHRNLEAVRSESMLIVTIAQAFILTNCIFGALLSLYMASAFLCRNRRELERMIEKPNSYVDGALKEDPDKPSSIEFSIIKEEEYPTLMRPPTPQSSPSPFDLSSISFIDQPQGGSSTDSPCGSRTMQGVYI